MEKGKNLLNVKTFHESYTAEENLLISNYLKNSSDIELATSLDTICLELLAQSDSNFPQFYQDQISLLELHKKKNDDIKYKKKYIKYLEKNIQSVTYETLHQPFLDAYNEYKKITGFTRDEVEDSFIAEIASEQLTKLKEKQKTEDKGNEEKQKAESDYKDYIESLFGENNYITIEEFIKIIRKSKVAKQPVKPESEKLHFSNAEILEEMGTTLLQYLLIQMIALLDKEDISNAYPIWLFTVASFCYRDSHNHTQKDRKYSSGKPSLNNSIKTCKKLDEEIKKLETIFEIAEKRNQNNSTSKDC